LAELLAPYNYGNRVIVCDLRLTRNLNIMRQQIFKSLEKNIIFS